MADRQIAILDAPSNLGLRPPLPGAVPGCYKMPWALRDRGLLASLGARDAGALVPPRYRAEWQPGEGDRNAEAIASFSLALADRVGAIIDGGQFALVLGGECSILVGNALALQRRGRYGLVYMDAHSDFRHPDNDVAIGAAGGEALAIMTGRGDQRLVNLDGQGPYIRERDMVAVGFRPEDDCRDELAALGILGINSDELLLRGTEDVARQITERVTAETQGFWVHLDWDVVDSSEMSAVDCPEPGGPSFQQVAALLGALVASPACVGLELTIYDPDLDPTGQQADAIVACLRQAFASFLA
ncbi:arginase family protein [Chloroflexia bacterium SDU3-3]|nr:arginase family protein [Chloroflexia bacterium SDU3-3]